MKAHFVGDFGQSDLVVDVRGKEVPVRIAKFPFLSARTKGDPRAERPLSV